MKLAFSELSIGQVANEPFVSYMPRVCRRLLFNLSTYQDYSY